MTTSAPIRIGTRASPLARWQAQWVADQLAAVGHTIDLVPITTRGDIDRQSPIGDIGTTGVFTKELQRALLDGRIAVAVHSLKDLPTDELPGLVLAAVPPRESARDALISRDALPLASLPAGARIGTGSLRRQAQLLYLRPDLTMAPIRGNVETRLRKLADGECDALVLAEAGLKRLGFAERITELFGPPDFMSAVGQGALGLETRAGDECCAVISQLNDPDSHAAVTSERAFLAAMQGGCSAPIGALAQIDADGLLHLEGVWLTSDGRERIAAALSAPPSEAADLGRRLANELKKRGARPLAHRSGDL
jgi:hydroxymethylbilane synthase